MFERSSCSYDRVNKTMQWLLYNLLYMYLFHDMINYGICMYSLAMLGQITQLKCMQHFISYDCPSINWSCVLYACMIKCLTCVGGLGTWGEYHSYPDLGPILFLGPGTLHYILSETIINNSRRYCNAESLSGPSSDIGYMLIITISMNSSIWFRVGKYSTISVRITCLLRNP